MTSLELYWIFQADEIRAMFGIFASILFALSGVMFAIITFRDDDDDDDEIAIVRISKKYLFQSFIFFLLALLIAAFLPSTKTLAAMYVIPPIVNNEKVQGIPDKLLNLLDDGIKQLRDDMGKDDK